jgi:hypothetical protein
MSKFFSGSVRTLRSKLFRAGPGNMAFAIYGHIGGYTAFARPRLRLFIFRRLVRAEAIRIRSLPRPFCATGRNVDQFSLAKRVASFGHSWPSRISSYQA